MKTALKVHSGHIVSALAERFDWFTNKMALETHIDGDIADLVFITKARYLTEIEIKVSRSDWNIDRAKDKWKRERPHVSRFYYAAPGPLAESPPDWLEPHVGIVGVWLNEFGQPFTRELRQAKRLKAQPVSVEFLRDINASMYYRYWRRELKLRAHQFRIEPAPIDLVTAKSFAGASA